MTNNLNSIIIEGNLTKDAEFDSTPKGTEFCIFSVAVNRFFKSGDEIQHEVSYFDAEAWGKLCENSRNILTKGTLVRIVGRLRQDRWTGDDGKARSRIKIVAEHIETKPVAPVQEKEPAADCEAGTAGNLK